MKIICSIFMCFLFYGFTLINMLHIIRPLRAFLK
nr:MAG TPA: Coiled-coil domain-containing protein [Siphoviridae sp. ctEfY6]